PVGLRPEDCRGFPSKWSATVHDLTKKKSSTEGFTFVKKGKANQNEGKANQIKESESLQLLCPE
ncbi:MAG: hypothetical protein ABI903_12870, partial [Actinomycetota bacterium]